MNRIQGRKKTGRKKKKIRIRMMRIPWKRMKIQMFRISLDSKSDPNPVRRWQCHNMLPASILRKSSAATIMKFELLTVRITSSIQNSELPTCARFPSTNVNIFRRCMFRPPSSALNAGTPSNPRTASSPSANSSSWATSSSSPRTSRPSPSLQRLRGQHQAYHCISNNNVSIFIFM